LKLGLPMQSFSVLVRRPVSSLTSISTSGRLKTLSRHFSATHFAMAPISKETELLVIGSGSGGLGAARTASAKYGIKAMIIEGGRIGGTCVNVG